MDDESNSTWSVLVPLKSKITSLILYQGPVLVWTSYGSHEQKKPKKQLPGMNNRTKSAQRAPKSFSLFVFVSLLDLLLPMLPVVGGK
jgi:hypothetical protein